MDAAQELFEKLQSFRVSVSPETLFLDYCKNVLGAVERVHFDFKEKQDTRDAKLSESDQKNLAKAISGFANSGGGVLIWGIEDGKLNPKPITDIEIFVSSILGRVSQITDPIVPGIDASWIFCDADKNKGYGFVFIPESQLPPHRVILKISEIKDKYYIRSGSSFGVASHSQLEDMFGRRPRPILKLYKDIVLRGGSGDNFDIYVFIGIENVGRGVAKAPYLSVQIGSPYKIFEYGIDGNKNYGLQQLTRPLNSKEISYGASGLDVIHSGNALSITVVKIETVSGKIHGGILDLNIKYKIAAEGVSLIEGKETISSEEIWKAIQNK